MSENKIIKKRRRADYEKLEQVVGCKWSVSVLLKIREGVCRPGALEREIEGISAKVLAERLRKLSGYKLIEKHVFREVPLRTEYSLTPAGEKLVGILAQIHQLDQELGSGD